MSPIREPWFPQRTRSDTISLHQTYGTWKCSCPCALRGAFRRPQYKSQGYPSRSPHCTQRTWTQTQIYTTHILSLSHPTLDSIPAIWKIETSISVSPGSLEASLQPSGGYCWGQHLPHFFGPSLHLNPEEAAAQVITQLNPQVACNQIHL